MENSPAPVVPENSRKAEAGRYFRYMAEFVGFSEADATAIRDSALVVEKHLPEMIGNFYTNLLQYPPTRKFFLKADGTVDEDYLKLRMYHQANFWRRTAGGVYDDDYAGFVSYVGRAHTSRGADPRLYIAERYVIGMVGFVQHAIIDALMQELHDFDPDLEQRAIKAWNKLCMVILEVLARAYREENEAEGPADLLPVDSQAVMAMSVQSYERGLGLRRNLERREVVVAREEEIPEGERKIVTVDGTSIGVFHYRGGWYALRNSCLHRGGPVATGQLRDGKLVCPWHGYTYDITTGRLLMDPDAKLDTYPVIVKDGEVRLLIPEKDALDRGFYEGPAASPDLAMLRKADLPALAEGEFWLQEVPPGKARLVKVQGRKVAVYNVGGQYYATADECTHAGGPLSEGELEGKQITCPWHFSCFDVTNGAVLCDPATEPVQTYKVEVQGDKGKVVV